MFDINSAAFRDVHGDVCCGMMFVMMLTSCLWRQTELAGECRTNEEDASIPSVPTYADRSTGLADIIVYEKRWACRLHEQRSAGVNRFGMTLGRQLNNSEISLSFLHKVHNSYHNSYLELGLAP